MMQILHQMQSDRESLHREGSSDQFSRRTCRPMSTMMGVKGNHTRGRPKQRRAGCLLCKSHKLSSAKKAPRRRGRRDAMLHEMRAAHDARYS
jgi:hypothetical protein